uniref:Uncharacterized protein n=1 Tax=Bostrychia moritziana TaxID=103713 RepID=A0A1Z1M7P3_BOSMO|nr:hypothetical protein [Bostrychia moritziana]ARW61774.1 hypothetical protein [Bostrychia moritziana]
MIILYGNNCQPLIVYFFKQIQNKHNYKKYFFYIRMKFIIYVVS